MSLLGFNAVGRLALGQITSVSPFTQLAANVGGRSKVGPSASPSYPAVARIGFQSKSSAGMGASFPATTRVGVQVRARSPGGVTVRSIVAGKSQIAAPLFSSYSATAQIGVATKAKSSAYLLYSAVATIGVVSELSSSTTLKCPATAKIGAGLRMNGAPGRVFYAKIAVNTGSMGSVDVKVVNPSNPRLPLYLKSDGGIGFLGMSYWDPNTPPTTPGLLLQTNGTSYILLTDNNTPLQRGY